MQKKIMVLSLFFVCLFSFVLQAEEDEKNNSKVVEQVVLQTEEIGSEKIVDETQIRHQEYCKNCCYEKCCKEIKKLLKDIDHDTDIANSQLRILMCIGESIKKMLDCDLCCKINHIVDKVDTIDANTSQVPALLESLQEM